MQPVESRRPRRGAVVAALALAIVVPLVAQQPPQGQEARLERGRTTARTLCAACHSEQPPAKLAPPLSHVGRYYRQAVPDSAQAVARLAAWVGAPAAERSLLPKAVRDRWGLMPPFPLPAEQAHDVAAYVWTLGAP